MSNTEILLRPSSAARRVQCPGSRALSLEPVTFFESSAASEGTRAHECAAKMLRGCDVSEYSDEMIEGAKLYEQCVSRVVDKAAIDGIEVGYEYYHIEEFLSVGDIHPACGGTPDCWFNYVERDEIHIWDYKYGHSPVDAFGNWQLIEYAAGALGSLEDDGYSLPKDGKVFLTVVQPRDYVSSSQVKTWATNVEELSTYFNILREVESESMSEGARLTVGDECKYCPARSICPALARSAASAIDISQERQALDLTPRGLGVELRFLKRAESLLNARVKALEEQTVAYLNRGDRVPFFRMEAGRPSKKWLAPTSDILAMGSMLGLDLAKPAAVITPTQAEKKGVPADVVNKMSKKKPGAMKLVAEKIRGVI